MDTMNIEAIGIESMEHPLPGGARFRRFRGKDDYPGMVDLINACGVVDQTEDVETLENIEHTYRHLSNCNFETDIIMAEAGERLVGFTRIAWRKYPDGMILYNPYGCVRPEWRRKGLGSALMSWSEKRIRQMAAEHEPGEKYIQVWAVDKAVGHHALLQATGFKASRHFNIMLRRGLEGLPDVSLPEGIEVRPVEKNHLRAIFNARAEAYQDHWGIVPPTEEDYQRWAENPTFDRSLWRIAWDGEQVAGTCMAEIIEADASLRLGRRAEIFGVSTRRTWRRRGIARALMVEVMCGLGERGIEVFTLGVDQESPTNAMRVYDALGFETWEVDTVYRKPVEMAK